MGMTKKIAIITYTFNPSMRGAVWLTVIYYYSSMCLSNDDLHAEKKGEVHNSEYLQKKVDTCMPNRSIN